MLSAACQPGARRAERSGPTAQLGAPPATPSSCCPQLLPQAALFREMSPVWRSVTSGRPQVLSAGITSDWLEVSPAAVFRCHQRLSLGVTSGCLEVSPAAVFRCYQVSSATATVSPGRGVAGIVTAARLVVAAGVVGTCSEPCRAAGRPLTAWVWALLAAAVRHAVYYSRRRQLRFTKLDGGRRPARPLVGCRRYDVTVWRVDGGRPSCPCPGCLNWRSVLWPGPQLVNAGQSGGGGTMEWPTVSQDCVSRLPVRPRLPTSHLLPFHPSPAAVAAAGAWWLVDRARSSAPESHWWFPSRRPPLRPGKAAGRPAVPCWASGCRGPPAPIGRSPCNCWTPTTGGDGPPSDGASPPPPPRNHQSRPDNSKTGQNRLRTQNGD